jgi:hypothetical protein
VARTPILPLTYGNVGPRSTVGRASTNGRHGHAMGLGIGEGRGKGGSAGGGSGENGGASDGQRADEAARELIEKLRKESNAAKIGRHALQAYSGLTAAFIVQLLRGGMSDIKTAEWWTGAMGAQPLSPPPLYSR